MTQPRDQTGDVTIPDEAIETVASAMHHVDADGSSWGEEPRWSQEVYRGHARTALETVTPAIVAANQPEPNDDLRARLGECLGWVPLEDTIAGEFRRECLNRLEAVVAAQVTAARAEGYKHGALSALRGAAADWDKGAATARYLPEQVAGWLRKAAAAQEADRG